MAFKRSLAILLSACIVPHVATTPVANTCQPVSDILKILNDPRISASATKFCSSFLSIPLQTVTNVATITAQAPVTTTTATATVSTGIVVTTTLGLPLTTAAPATNKEKRAGTLPPYLAAFASQKVSSACSCLSITPAKTTIQNTATVTSAASTITAATTVTSVSTSTSTVLGVAPECVPTAITNSPARLFQPGNVGIAGTAQEVGSRFPINNLQDCCSACYLDTNSCVAFTYGNFDNQQITYPEVLDNPSTTNTCRIYRDVFQDCANDVIVFTTNAPPLAGEVNNVGIGPCTPDFSV
ncbi:MAG: hypothetical protein LQ339_008847 [Xanthoria mediterranea]|nr:MAG: hypothetical protein LQ339_008847 [Xanthoria mediterranea]